MECVSSVLKLMSYLVGLTRSFGILKIECMKIILVSLILFLSACSTKSESKKLDHAELIQQQMLDNHQRRQLDYLYRPPVNNP